jgi:hypothetical protein
MNELWLDSPAGWIAVVDGSSRYSMVQRFAFHPETDYPGKASVIFYNNGSTLEIGGDGQPRFPITKTRAPCLWKQN